MGFRMWTVAMLALGLLVPWGNSAFAGDDPSIQGELRAKIRKAMHRSIDQKTVDGVYRFFDPVTNEFLRLQFVKLHSGIVKRGDFYTSCADFTDQHGRLADVDLLVIRDDGDLRVTQAVLHVLGGEKRPLRITVPVEPADPWWEDPSLYWLED